MIEGEGGGSSSCASHKSLVRHATYFFPSFQRGCIPHCTHWFIITFGIDLSHLYCPAPIKPSGSICIAWNVKERLCTDIALDNLFASL